MNFRRSGCPCLVIQNNQVVGGQDGVMREIFRTEAFFVETPELKSKQGVFGSPYFLHSYLNISEPVALGFIDYVLYGQAKVTCKEGSLPPIPDIIKCGKKTAPKPNLGKSDDKPSVLKKGLSSTASAL